MHRKTLLQHTIGHHQKAKIFFRENKMITAVSNRILPPVLSPPTFGRTR